MPWKETHVQEERMKFITMRREDEGSIAELCREFGISRPTGYKFLHRYEENGIEGLLDRSRAPHNHPNEVPKEVEDLILELKTQRPTWGPNKLRARLMRLFPDRKWPVASTIGEMLKRRGLTRTRRRRGKASPSPKLTAPDVPNAVWSADFKGHFHTGDGRRCDPFTLMDAHSRYLLRCQALVKIDGATVMPLFAAAFREFGLPAVIRTDNGSPFGSSGLGGLSRLSVWFLKLGIKPERIKPGRPQENGSHERMHLTLKRDVTCAPSANLRAQQRAFDRFLRVYNEERPHEALENQTPADLYVPSPRRCPLRVREFTYPADYIVRRVRKNGQIRWHGREVFVSEVLVGEMVGLLPLTERHWAVHIGPLAVAVVDNAGKKRLPDAKAAPLLQMLHSNPPGGDCRMTLKV